MNFLKLLACLFPFHWIKNDSFDNIGFTPLDESQKAKIEKSWGISFTVSIWQTISSKSYSRLLSLASFGDASSIISGLPYFASRLQSKYFFFARNLNTSLIFALVTPSFGKHGGAVGESVEFLVCNVLFCLLCFSQFWLFFKKVSNSLFGSFLEVLLPCLRNLLLEHHQKNYRLFIWICASAMSHFHLRTLLNNKQFKIQVTILQIL